MTRAVQEVRESLAGCEHPDIDRDHSHAGLCWKIVLMPTDRQGVTRLRLVGGIQSQFDSESDLGLAIVERGDL
jgi:hypothetical protein